MSPVGPTAPIQLTVDARDPASGKIHSHLTIPAHAGELRLEYPKWVPGEHRPSGPINDVVDLRVSAQGKPLAWRRNPDDMFELIVNVPAGASSVEVDFEELRTPGGRGGAASPSTPRMVDVVWNHAIYYPKGPRASAIVVEPTVRLPPGWAYATALSGGTEHDGAVTFAKVSLEMLVDSPLVAGPYLKNYDLGTVRGTPHALTALGDTPESVVAPPELVEKWKRLVLEADALFGAHHYQSYRFLLLLGDDLAYTGLEHHQSSEDSVKERALIEPDVGRLYDDLLSHEYAHSWNGKYRRPRGLATPSFQEPMRGDLLWVYEGLTQYLGVVLAARSGLRTLDDAKLGIAHVAKDLDIDGRTWRPLVDTAAAAQLLYTAPDSGYSQRRSVDYYDEGLLIWLEADVLIRQQTKGARSLDDFCRAFHGGKDGVAEVKTYELEDVVKTMNAVAPHDWKAFFDERVYRVAPKVPVQGVLAAGYTLGTTDKKPERWSLDEKTFKTTTFWDSLGFHLDEESIVQDVRAGGPSSKAGLTSKAKVIAVDGHKLTGEAMSAALLRAKSDAAPIELLVERDGYFRTVKVDYHGGEQYPALERDPQKPDVLAAILAPKAMVAK